MRWHARELDFFSGDVAMLGQLAAHSISWHGEVVVLWKAKLATDP